MKRKILLISLVVLLVSSLSLAATLMFFQDKTEEKVNTFTVGKVKITLTEPLFAALDANGKVLVPGSKITKDPTVKVVGGSEECYVRVKVEMTDALKDKLETIVFGDKWSLDAAGFYRYADKVTKSATDTTLQEVFKEIQPKAAADLSTLAENDLKIKITAYAIQSATFATADAAWTAFVVTP